MSAPSRNKSLALAAFFEIEFYCCFGLSGASKSDCKKNQCNWWIQTSELSSEGAWPMMPSGKLSDDLVWTKWTKNKQTFMAPRTDELKIQHLFMATNLWRNNIFADQQTHEQPHIWTVCAKKWPKNGQKWSFLAKNCLIRQKFIGSFPFWLLQRTVHFKTNQRTNLPTKVHQHELF